MIKFINQITMRVSMTLVAATLLVICIMLLADKCTQDPPVPSYGATEKRIADSLDKVYKTDRKADIKELNRLQRRSDSLQILLSNTNKALSLSSRTSVRLATELELARRNKDTVEYQSNCDSLAEEVVRQEAIISHQEDLLTQSFDYQDSIVTNMQKQIDAGDKAYNSLKKSFDFMAEQNKFLGMKVNNLQKKNDRKYSVAVSFGYGQGITGRPQPFAGITLSRSLFKFKL